jgi:hypothetical protein
MSVADRKITISPVLPSDFSTIARLEATAFAEDDFSTVAFGTQRFSDEALATRTAAFGAGPKAGESLRFMKAVIAGSKGEEIVGFASWTFCEGRGGAGGEANIVEKKEEVKGMENESEMDMFGPGGNMKFFEDSILKRDEHMARSTEGRDYASKWCSSPLLCF